MPTRVVPLRRKKWTKVTTVGRTCTVRYHNTNVVTFDDDIITLNHGGFKTATTKLRMNQAAREFGLLYNVFQNDYTWYVRVGYAVPGVKVLKFEGNTITIDRLTYDVVRETQQASRVGGVVFNKK